MLPSSKPACAVGQSRGGASLVLLVKSWGPAGCAPQIRRTPTLCSVVLAATRLS